MASATRSRFGFHDRFSSLESVVSETSPPGRSMIVEHAQSSAVRGMSDWNESFEFREDPSFWKDHNVQVIIRIRPLSSSEVSLQGHSKCIRQESSQTLTWTGHPESRFTFDLVADENVTQENLFKVAGVPMVENCVEGYNSCMFAYGQTGSGKTHTMLGDIEGGSRRHSVNAGMTPRVFEYLFSRIQKEKEARKEEKIRFTCKCSFLEIYNEQILDLLDPSSNNLQIREDIKKGIHVENIKEIEVSSARDVMQQLIQGAANRKVAATNMNRASSRSHSVFTCIIESTWESLGVNHHRFARLNLVDLAGSERQKSSGAEGERLKEATNINKSLSTLGLVIMNLVNVSNGKSLHVPYRDSKLTFLLQDSLGGNSKTIIIANITPSTCCSLETLSTLKFAQRAKFIKNNAIVNEDACGDVIGMRLQIQQLKKEVSHLRGLINGGSEDLVNDMSTLNCSGSPVSFKWQGLNGSFSPLTSDKSMAKKDAALLGALRREKEKDITLEALAAESQAAMQLAKQREDEIQGLKLRLRFREAGIKRLEQVSSGKFSAEAHLLKERDEFMKEIEVLRSQVSRNQEVTRFAMENLRLKDEIRRLKAFCEEGERETMNEEIMALRYKLLEALDWKLMHEKDTVRVQNEIPDKVSGSNSDGNMPISGQEESAWRSRLNEENEFLRMQAIQNRSEMEALQKKMGSCLEEKEKLERYVNELLQTIEQERSTAAAKEKLQQMDSNSQQLVHASDQLELKTMVDAIAAATSREAEALERVYKLSQENDELRLKLKGYVEDNKHLLELYEQKTEEITRTEAHENHTLVHDAPSEERYFEIKKVVEDLEQQLAEMHEENDKLMGLYEKAMQERDEFKRMLCSGAQNSSESKTHDCPEKLTDFHAEECLKRDDEPVGIVSDDLDIPAETWNPHGSFSYTHTESLDFAHMKQEDLNHVREEIENVQKKLSLSSKHVAVYNSLVRALLEVEKLSRDIEALEGCIKEKQVDFEATALLYSNTKERRNVISNKLSALRCSLSKISSSVSYFAQRETRARHRLDSSLSYLEKMKAELAYLQKSKDAMETSKSKIQEAEVDERTNLARLKLKLEEENRRQENQKVLFPIDNMEKNDDSCRLHLGGKATELLKSEEDKNKLQNEIKLSREKLVTLRKEFEVLDENLVKLENELHSIKKCVEKGTKTVEDMKFALQGVTEEKETLFTVRGDGEAEIESLILEYQQQVFETDLHEAEMEIINEEIQVDRVKMEQLRAARTQVSLKLKQLLDDRDDSSPF